MCVGWQALLKHTEDTHVDYAGLVQACKQVKSINDLVNESKRKAEQRQAVLDLLSNTHSFPDGFVCPSLPFPSFPSFVSDLLLFGWIGLDWIGRCL